jgi:hypothetical protein
MKIPPECEKIRDDSSIVISDPGSKNNRSKFRLNNLQKASISVIRVDGCAIKTGIRCDYLLGLPSKQEIYIELKGSDIKHAVEQLARSIEMLSCHNELGGKLCFVASTKCPINSTEIQVLKKKFRKKYNAKLTIKNGEIIHEYCP